MIVRLSRLLLCLSGALVPASIAWGQEEAIVEQPLAWVKARACEQITRENGSPRTEKRLAFDRPA